MKEVVLLIFLVIVFFLIDSKRLCAHVIILQRHFVLLEQPVFVHLLSNIVVVVIFNLWNQLLTLLAAD